ncbi:TraB/GumN family protein [Yoonia sp. I 8.24]|uniref:TraB/GumN family protein n=1 Tax=Yoonia sp. I 8.24 TaxID=1537229 RepID=UPI001EE0E4C4|nr:TraB/GumN family protein [Yoonia sp. I 8.24]MCG3269216.1 TraB/GumN family protein [Yoonia sp. I 8.24]
MFLRAAATALFSVFSLPALALCAGESYLDQLSAEQHQKLSAAVADIPFAQGLVWDARKDTQNLRIVGTMHIYDPRLGALFASISASVASADLILVEATPDDQADLQQLMARDPSQLFLVDGPTLPELLDGQTWELLLQAAADRSIPSFMIAKMQPWYASLLLAMPPCAMDDVIAGRLGLDHMIMDAAAEAGVPMQSLEAFTTLFAIFQEESLDEQIEFLRMGLMMPDTQQQVFVAMLDRYFAKDVGTLWEMSRLTLADLPELDLETATVLFDETQESILDERNRNWIPVITEATKSHNNVIVAAGAAHLIGENGILNLLQNDGWTLTRAD